MKNIKMKHIKMKNLLAENMRRFGTKNLSEQSANVPADGTTNLKEEYNSDQFYKFTDDVNNGTPIKAKIKIGGDGGEIGVITLTNMEQIRPYKYTGILSDNGGISSIQVLNGQNVILNDFPKTFEYNSISNTTGKEEIETIIGMQDGVIFQFLGFV